jgi:hypothetical protein
MAGFSALKGYSIDKDMQWIQQGLQMGRERLFERGMLPSGVMSLSHKKERDSRTGKAIRLVPNEDVRKLYECIGELLLDGVAWNQLGTELYNRWGICAPNGNYYAQATLRYMMYNPLLWGNVSMRRTGKKIGEWVFYDHPTRPDNLNIQYGVVEPLLTGEFAGRIRDELIRRFDMLGSRRPHLSYRFSDTCICGLCGARMNVASSWSKTRPSRKVTYYANSGVFQYGLICPFRYYTKNPDDHRCPNKFIHHEALEHAWNQLIEHMLGGKKLSDYLVIPDEERVTADTDYIRLQIEKTQAQIATLIYEQSLAPESAQAIYRQQIVNLSDKMAGLENSLKTALYAQRQSTSDFNLDDIKVEAFWDLPDREINQILKSLLGDYRLEAIGDEIVGMKLVEKK